MDPNVALETMRRLSARLFRTLDAEEGGGVDTEDALELAEAAQALDQWLSRGGFLPSDWAKAR